MTEAGSKPPSRTRAGEESIKAVPVRHPGRWVAAGIVLLLTAMLVHSLFFSYVYPNGVKRERFEWSIIGHYFFSHLILQGLVTTIELTLIAMAGGIILGLVLAVMRLSPNPIVSSSSWGYIWFFRGTPVLVQLFFWEFAAYLFPSFSIGIPFGPSFVHITTNSVLTPLVAASLGLCLNEGAYMSEIVRAGIVSVDEGQLQAAMSIGMPRLLALRTVVLPQAMRVIIPPTGNETISMLKTTAVASVVTVYELTFQAAQIAASIFKPSPLYIVAALWYLIVTTVMMIGQYYVERYYARGSVRQLPPTPLQRLRRGLLIRPDGRGFGRFPGAVGTEGWVPAMPPQQEVS